MGYVKLKAFETHRRDKKRANTTITGGEQGVVRRGAACM